MIYSDKKFYIFEVIALELGGRAMYYDVQAIADDMLIWQDHPNPNLSGFVEDETKNFWEVVESHAL